MCLKPLCLDLATAANQGAIWPLKYLQSKQQDHLPDAVNPQKEFDVQLQH
jgi:hypothetical protein